MVETTTPVRPKKNTTGKKIYYNLYLENDKGQKVRNCQKMFLSTIDLTTDETIGTVFSKSGGSRTNNVSDKR